MHRLEIVCKSISTMFERVLTLNMKRHWSTKFWHVQIFIQNMVQVPTFKNKHTKKIHIVQGWIYKPLIVWGNICVCVSNIGFYFGGTYVMPMMMYMGIKIVFHIWMGNMEQWTHTFWLFHKTFGDFFPKLQIWFLGTQFFFLELKSIIFPKLYC